MEMHVLVRSLWLVTLVALAFGSTMAGGKEKIHGYAEYREGGALVVDGQRVVADGKTRFRGDAPRLDLIPLGYEVWAKGKRRDDGSLVASKIEMRRNGETSTERELKAGFDQIESFYRQKGRMAQPDANGKIVQDFGPLLESGPQVQRARRITDALMPAYVDPADVRVYVVENEEWNAMAAPNYSIYVFSGLLEDMDDDEVALVLGHELAHATYEHSRRQYSRSLWVQLGAVAATAVAGETIDEGAGRQAAELGSMLAASAVVSGYSRDHEDQADRVGMRYAHEAGYDVTKGPELWNRFAEKYGESDVVVNFFFGEHSRSSKRAELLQTEIDRNYRSPDTDS
jgi:Zn-dependent protease with chaperone function